MNYFLSDANNHQHLLPLTFTRPVGALRIGIRTIQEQWAAALGQDIGFVTQAHLQALFGAQRGDEDVDINGGLLPNTDLIDAIRSLEPGQALVNDEHILALASAGTEGPTDMHWERVPAYMEKVPFTGDVVLIDRPWKVFLENEKAIKAEFQNICSGRESQAISTTNSIIGDPDLIFLEEGAKVDHSYLNTTDGPIYIGKNAEIMEGCMVRGPFALCEHSILKMGCKVYGATTLGPHSKFGGELNNVVVQGYSNKAHDGFLGNSVLGEWCNLGADTNNSNLKNNYGEVKIWSYANQSMIGTGQQFCGLIMGDHAKCGINTMLNTGAVVGVAANIFGGDFPPKFIPSFSWGSAAGFQEHDFEKAMCTARVVMARRSVPLGPNEVAMLNAVFDADKAHR